MASRTWPPGARVWTLLPVRWVAIYGFIAGMCASVTGYAVTYLIEGRRVSAPTRPLVEFFWIGIDAGSELNVGPTGPLPEPYQFVAWQFLTLHGADFERYVHHARFGELGHDAWTLAPPETQVLVFVPAVLLLTAGVAVVSRCGADNSWMAARRGGTVALGYLPLVVLLALGSHWAAPESVAFEYFGLTTRDPRPVVTLGISAFPAATIAGIVYPAAFGGIGGTLAFLWSRRTWPTSGIARGIVAGGIAFLIGWGLTVRRAFARASQGDQWRISVTQAGPGEELSVAFDPGALRVGTWRFHRFHGGGVDVRYVEGVTDGIDRVVLPVVQTGLGEFHLPFVPMAVFLVVAGGVIADRAETRNAWGAAARGGAVAVGYLSFSLATAFLLTSETTGEVQAVVGMSLVDAFLRTGIAFPVAFGALGGLIVYALARIE